jgi:hypothetical protein
LDPQKKKALQSAQTGQESEPRRRDHTTWDTKEVEPLSHRKREIPKTTKRWFHCDCDFHLRFHVIPTKTTTTAITTITTTTTTSTTQKKKRVITRLSIVINNFYSYFPFFRPTRPPGTCQDDDTSYGTKQ